MKTARFCNRGSRVNPVNIRIMDTISPLLKFHFCHSIFGRCPAAVEYTGYIYPECPGYDIKPSDNEAPALKIAIAIALRPTAVPVC